MTNFNQILDEIQQQKVSVASSIDSVQLQIQASQAEITQLQQRLLDFQSQLAALTLLQERTTELQESTPVSAPLTTSAFVDHSVSG